MATVRFRSRLAETGTTGAVAAVVGLALAWLTPLDPFSAVVLALAAVGRLALVLFGGRVLVGAALAVLVGGAGYAAMVLAL